MRTVRAYRATPTGAKTQASPAQLVKATFDNFAPHSTSNCARSATGRQELASLLLPQLPQPFDMLDLGCGTGACGVAFGAQRARCVGVDISPKMLQRAKALGIYKELHDTEILEFLESSPAASYDVVIAADVFIYIGALEDVFRAVARVLRDEGWLAFSTEEEGDGDYVLRRTGRYAHAQGYIDRLCADAFEVNNAEPVVIRTEGERTPGSALCPAQVRKAGAGTR